MSIISFMIFSDGSGPKPVFGGPKAQLFRKTPSHGRRSKAQDKPDKPSQPAHGLALRGGFKPDPSPALCHLFRAQPVTNNFGFIE